MSEVAAEPTVADRAVAHILRQMRADERVAYLLGWGTESFQLLTAAFANRHGLDLDQFRRDLRGELRQGPRTEAETLTL